MTDEREIKVELDGSEISGTFHYKNVKQLIRDVVLLGSLLFAGSSYLQNRSDIDSLRHQLADRQQQIVVLQDAYNRLSKEFQDYKESVRARVETDALGIPLRKRK